MIGDADIALGNSRPKIYRSPFPSNEVVEERRPILSAISPVVMGVVCAIVVLAIIGSMFFGAGEKSANNKDVQEIAAASDYYSGNGKKGFGLVQTDKEGEVVGQIARMPVAGNSKDQKSEPSQNPSLLDIISKY